MQLPQISDWIQQGRSLLLFFQFATPREIAELHVLELKELKRLLTNWFNTFHEGRGAPRVPFNRAIYARRSNAT
jgi:hypothetical protein